MAVSKVILNGVTLMDVTQKTVTAETLLLGETALKNDGTDVVGTYQGGGSQNVTVSCSAGNAYITLGQIMPPTYGSASNNVVTIPQYGAFFIEFNSGTFDWADTTGTVEWLGCKYGSRGACVVYAGENGGTITFYGAR